MTSTPDPRHPLRVVPHYAPPTAARCHVHHADGVVAVLVGGITMSGPLLTKLHQRLDAGEDIETWFDEARAADVIGAAVAEERDETRIVSFAGEIEVRIETEDGYRVHVGGSGVSHLERPASEELRLLPRPAPSVVGTSLDRGTVVAEGAVVLAGQPEVADIRRSMADLEVLVADEVPEPEPEVVVPVPSAPSEGPDLDAMAPPIASDGPPTTPAPVVTDAPPPPPSSAPSAPLAPPPPPASDAGPSSVASSRKIDLSAPPPPAESRAPLPVEESATPDDEVVMVRGLQCRLGHHNHPEARLCAQCGDAMQNLSIALGTNGELGHLGIRPPLGIITFDDGQAFQLAKTTVIGRQPGEDDASTTVLAFPNDDTMSRRHLAVELDGWNVTLRDLGSSNGTGVRFPGAANYSRLEANRAYALPSNTIVVVGSRWFTFTATSAAPANPTR